MNHKEVRVILNPKAEIPADVKRENDLLTWADHVHITAMRTVAAGVLTSTESLDTAASVLSWSGFTVPAGTSRTITRPMTSSATKKRS
ncbi:hypothetical protein [Rubrobacter indicoceani]|uniref:hypothetical protein n=1 Tax=Rubrobacter indicoceani TaxID=2051957 RepID=UPI000E5A92AA|nr:hypothetical protein [Rubrobacter indicoceani]